MTLQVYRGGQMAADMRSYWIGFVDTEVMISAKVLESGLFEVVKSALSCCNAIAIPKLQPVC